MSHTQAARRIARLLRHHRCQERHYLPSPLSGASRATGLSASSRPLVMQLRACLRNRHSECSRPIDTSCWRGVVSISIRCCQDFPDTL